MARERYAKVRVKLRAQERRIVRKKCRDRKKIIWREKKLQRATYTKQYREIQEKRRQTENKEERRQRGDI